MPVRSDDLALTLLGKALAMLPRAEAEAMAEQVGMEYGAAMAAGLTGTDLAAGQRSLRSALHERGTAPYLAGLRLSQARTCGEFLDAATYWYAPSENLVCGDVDGNIAWRASALRRRPTLSAVSATASTAPGTSNAVA